MAGRGSRRTLINLVIQEKNNGCSGNTEVLADMPRIGLFSSLDLIKAQQELHPTVRNEMPSSSPCNYVSSSAMTSRILHLPILVYSLRAGTACFGAS